MAFKIFITNLGKYNEGELVGEWVELPTDRETMQEVFKRIEIGPRYEEWFITDYDDENGVVSGFGEYESLNELNYLAELIDDLERWSLEILQAVIEHEGHGDVADMINLIDNLDCYQIYPDVNSDYDLGFYWIEDSGCYNISEYGVLSNYIDYESFGRDVRIEEGGSFVSAGYIYDTGDSRRNWYTGPEDIPDEFKIVGPVDDDDDEKDEVA